MKKQDPSLNSTKHGCRCSYVRLLPGETMDDYNQIAQTWLTKFLPSDDAQLALVEMLVDAAWQVRRSQRNFENVQFSFFQQNPDQATWTTEQLHRLTLAKRYKTADINTFNRALKAVEDMKKNDHAREMRLEQWLKCIVHEAELCDSDRKFNNKTRDLLRTRPDFPKVRHDGGCPCTLCLYKLGVDQFYAAAAEKEKNKCQDS